MERILNIHIEKLPEGVYLAASDDIQGLVAQGRTVAETIELARDVARKLLEEHCRLAGQVALTPTPDAFDCPLILGASGLNSTVESRVSIFVMAAKAAMTNRVLSVRREPLDESIPID